MTVFKLLGTFYACVHRDFIIAIDADTQNVHYIDLRHNKLPANIYHQMGLDIQKEHFDAALARAHRTEENYDIITHYHLAMTQAGLEDFEPSLN